MTVQVVVYIAHVNACIVTLPCEWLSESTKHAFAGGLRLEPSSAELWAGLGTCARGPPQQEYAFTRSLHLDPKCARTWAALGRLYMESGARSLADTCFTQARSQEPADSATWAAMGALAGLSPTGGAENPLLPLQTPRLPFPPPLSICCMHQKEETCVSQLHYDMYHNATAVMLFLIVAIISGRQKNCHCMHLAYVRIGYCTYPIDLS